MKYVAAITILFSLYSCSLQYYGAKGLTIREAIKTYNITIGEYFVEDEPPGVPRGIYGKAPNGKTIIFYFGRGEFSEKSLWNINDFMEYKVIDVSVY